MKVLVLFQVLKDYHLYAMVIGIVSIVLIILVVWEIIDPQTVVTVEGDQLVRTRKAFPNPLISNVFLI
jgi:hypothetical protein